MIHHLLGYIAQRHADTQHESDMPTLAGRLGYGYRTNTLSFFDPETQTINVQRTKDKLEARADAAHEMAHALLREGGPSYEEVIRYRHAQAPNLEAHLERLVEHGGDVLQMPDELMHTVLRLCGTNAQAVWIIHQMAQAQLPDALRRLVTFNEDGRRGGFIAQHGKIIHAYSYQYYLRCWVGDDVPDEGSFQGSGVSLFQVPGFPSMHIGLVVVDD